jgi:beta-phosphoglucomutase-like phosphatase (HAD superfamily)
MQIQAVIFDMDGLLIDSEPCWQEAGKETLLEWGHTLTTEQYHKTTGLRTEEWIEHWFQHFNIDMKHKDNAVDVIIRKAIDKIDKQAVLMDGANEIVAMAQERVKVGLATSSPMQLVEVVLPKLSLTKSFNIISSAESLPYGKPHPQVYLNCAEQLDVNPLHCLAFEDSFNGMIAAKAARMKCVVVPAKNDYDAAKWTAADYKLNSLKEFNWGMI